MTVAEAKELERLRIQEVAVKRSKEFDAKQQEIDGQMSRRSGAWHKARTDLALARLVAGIEDRIEIRKEMVAKCPDLATPHEASQFETSTSAVFEGQIQASLQSFAIVGVRAPASVLSEIPTLKAATKLKLNAAIRMMRLEVGREKTPLPTTLNVSGPNARVSINSNDVSTNTVLSSETSAQHLRLQAHPNLAVSVKVDSTGRTLTIEISNRGAYPFRLNNTEISGTDDDGEAFVRKVRELSGGVIVGSGHNAYAVEFLNQVNVELQSGAFEEWVQIEFDCEDVMGLVKKRYSYTRLFGLREA